MTKQKLIETIEKITDQSILDDIQRLIELESDEEVFVTSAAQKSVIELAQSDVRNRKTIDDQASEEDIDQWLDK